MSPTDLSKAAGISVPYAWQILEGKRTPSLSMALLIYDRTGTQFGQLEGLSKREIETARKMAA
jgi:transcriptional regulator with XRE-family HTH domain